MKPSVAMLLLLLLATSEWRPAGANSFGVSLQELLARTGLERQRSALSEQQLQLIRDMSGIFQRDDQLEEEEAALLLRAGLGEPSGQDKNTLKSMSNEHLRNSLHLDRLAAQLAQSVADERLRLARQSL